MSSDEIVIDVRNLAKHYEIYATPRDRLKQLIFPPLQKIANRIGSVFGISTRRDPPRFYREFHALNEISFQVRRGETLGIIGRNGSGKSTLLQIVAGTLAQTSGEVSVNGRVAALLELGSGFNPEFTGRENVFLNGQILGLTQKEIESRYDQITEFADIGEFINQPVKTYSSGMFVRLAFAVQAHIDASIVIIDEALAVGDIFFRQKCYARLDVLRASGAAIILVSHSMGDIEQHCDRSILLDHGNMICFGSSAEAIKEYYLLEQAGRLLAARSDADVALPADSATLQFPEHALLPIEGLRQINAQSARCLRVALTDVKGRSQRSFRFGETAVFHHDHYFGFHSGVPIGGIIIHTEKGVILHGKSSLQARIPFDCSAPPGSVVRFEHRVTLSIAPGEYTFDIGMSAIDVETLNAIEQLTHEGVDVRKIHLVQLPKAGSFTVLPKGPDHPRMADFHGLIDLPSDIKVTVFSDTSLVVES